MSTMASSAKTTQVKVLTYNIWSCEHVAVYRRIQSICGIIQRNDPDVILLQEVTKYTRSILQKAPWWSQYKNSSCEYERSRDYLAPNDENEKHFCLMLCKAEHEVFWGIPKHSIPDMRTAARDLVTASVRFHDEDAPGGYRPVRVATCRLMSPTPSDVRCMDRGAKASLFLDTLDDCWDWNWNWNSVFGGDMNWDDDLDGPFPIEGRGGWVDAWCALRPGAEGNAGSGGWTYDAVANPMLRGRKPERKRPDRFVCMLTDFTLDSIEMVGVEPIPGVTYCDDKGNVLPVLPSHRFGLLLTMSPKQN